MNITHNPTAQCFETFIEGHRAYLSYEIVDDTTLNYNHTIVPKALDGQGIGTALVKYALEYAKAHHKKIVPSCSFVVAFIQRRPEYQDIIA